MRVVLGLGLFLGLGTVPLWPLVPACAVWLVLGTGHGLGTFLGFVAVL